MVMEKASFALKGTICYAKTMGELETLDQGYVVCRQGICEGAYPVLPKEYEGLPVIDYKNMLIIPGLVDLHIHAPQYPSQGLGLDLELLDWLKAHTFPEESRYGDMEYAKKAYRIFAQDLKNSATTRAVIFSTIHTDAAKFLMEALNDAGLVAFVGKVNMDQNCDDRLKEDTDASIEATVSWLDETLGKYETVRPILTPRFAPSCSEALLEGLGGLQKKYKIPVQSHLSENLSEISWVKELFPWSSCYGDVYERFGLFGGEAKTVMAHCVYSSKEEVARIKQNGVHVAHCPQSNVNLASGIAPIRKYLDEGIAVGLGTDVAGGASMSMFRCIVDAICVSKLYWRLLDQSKKPLTMEEAFYLATKGGGAFFGKVGSFEKGYEMDALVLDDGKMNDVRKLDAKQRLERYFYLAEEKGRIAAKYVGGADIWNQFSNMRKT